MLRFLVMTFIIFVCITLLFFLIIYSPKIVSYMITGPDGKKISGSYEQKVVEEAKREFGSYCNLKDKPAKDGVIVDGKYYDINAIRNLLNKGG